MMTTGNMMKQRITGIAYSIPDQVISNEELVSSFNDYIDQEFVGRDKTKEYSSADFIEQASGIRQRHVIDKEGILNIDRMRPCLPVRNKDTLALQTEFSLPSCREAIKDAKLNHHDIDAVIVACSIVQRSYPGIAVEIKKALGIEHGWAYDMTSGCSSAIFGISMAVASLRLGLASKILVVTPELYTCHSNFRDRRSHFIFGDGCSALVIENVAVDSCKPGFDIVDVELKSDFSNNIRNDIGFLNACEDYNESSDNYMFKQIGKNVREEVVPVTVEHLKKHCEKIGLDRSNVKKLWLHQANIHINRNIAHQFFGHEVNDDQCPNHLNEIANTGASGVVISFKNHHEGLVDGERGILCAFGSGYSLGSVIVQRKEAL